VDVLLLHALPSDYDLTAVNSANGAWTFLKEAKAAGTAKFIGYSSMDNTAAAAGGVLNRFITDLNPDVVTLAMNVSGYGNCKNVTLPIANTANCGVGAIKTLLGVVNASRTAAQALAYLWELKDANSNYRIATCIVGHDGGASQVDANVASAKLYGATGVLSYDLEKIERDAKPLAGPHALAWARPDFKDNGKPYIWS
jgi:predicted aldo/keto reductase-like oxidoreductase